VVEISFDGLVEAHAGELLGFLQRMLQDRQEAEDVLQESFLRAYRAFPRLNADAHHRGWLYRIAINTARTQLGRRRPESLPPEALDDLAGEENTPEDQHMQGDLMAAVYQAVEALPQQQRAALLLRMFQGLEYDVVAEALGCNSETARAHVYQAVRKLRSRFAAEPGHGRSR